MERLLSILVLFAICLAPIGSPADDLDAQPPLAEYHLGFCLQPSGNTTWYSTGIVKVHDGKIISIRHIDPKDFVLMGTGLVASEANPEQINLFEKYEVEACVARFDSIGGDFEVACNPVNNIWKLRYNKHPAPDDAMKDRTGWSGMKYKPTDGQLGVLGQYGIKHVIHFTYGEDAFRLLRDMNNPAWVASYRGS